MFNENYYYLASTLKEMQSHWGQLANTILKNLECNKKSFIVEIGSNDGIFLKNISDKNIPHLGVMLLVMGTRLQKVKVCVL